MARSSPKGVLGAFALVLVGLMLFSSGLCGCGTGGSTGVDADGPPTEIDPSRLVRVSLIRVVDGDTILVRMPDGRRERVRYTGIDTPELARDGERAEPFAEEAATRNAELLARRPLHLEFDVEERDRHGRRLAYVWAVGEMVNLRLVREGYAVALTVPPNVRYTDEFVEAQMKARIEGLGRWAPVGMHFRTPTGVSCRAHEVAVS